MSYVVLHADRLRTVATDDALVPAADVQTLRDTAALLAEAGRLRDDAEAEIASARADAQEAGYATGQEQARLAGEARTTEALVSLKAAADESLRQQRDDIARLALEVVRRIAGELPAGAMVAALAERAAATLAADAGAVVRVAPAAVDLVRQRLSAQPAFVVEADPSLAETDCVLETPLGRTHAGLETQLAAIQRTWATA